MEQRIAHASENPLRYKWLHSMHAVDNPWNVDTEEAHFFDENNEEFRHLQAAHKKK